MTTTEIQIEVPDGNRIERLLIVRLSAMGDVIHTLPAAQLLRDAFPRATIGWLVEERWAELLCAPRTPRAGARSPRRPLVDRLHAVNLKGWRKSLSIQTALQVAKVWNDVRDIRYDVAIDLQGAMRSAILARWSNAPVVFGAAQPRESPASLWYTRPILTHGAHVIEQNISLAEAVTEQRALPSKIEFPRDPAAEERIDLELKARGAEFAIMNPGAGWGAKRWPAKRYGQVARDLARNGLRSVLNFGPGEEELVRVAQAASGGAAEAVNCSLTELIALTRRAQLFIGGDTGPLHLAAALQVPVVAIFGPTDPTRNGPYGTRSVVLRNAASVTSHSRRTQPDQGLLEIRPEAVIAAARSLLAGAG